jgi:hypothetical protein
MFHSLFTRSLLLRTAHVYRPKWRCTTKSCATSSRPSTCIAGGWGNGLATSNTTLPAPTSHGLCRRREMDNSAPPRRLHVEHKLKRQMLEDDRDMQVHGLCPSQWLMSSLRSALQLQLQGFDWTGGARKHNFAAKDGQNLWRHDRPPMALPPRRRSLATRARTHPHRRRATGRSRKSMRRAYASTPTSTPAEHC